MSNTPAAFRQYPGAIRVPTFLMVPLVPLIVSFAVLLSVGMVGSVIFGLKALLVWLLIVPVWAVMFGAARHNDRAFRLIALFIETKGVNRHKAFWGASTYAIAKHRRFKRAGVGFVHAPSLLERLRPPPPRQNVHAKFLERMANHHE